MQRWICLRLSELAAQCLAQQRPQALAVIEGQRIHTVNAAGALLGVEPGMDPASARALAGDTPLQLLARNKTAEDDALDSLSCWAYGLTPHLYRFREDCLMLEISGSLRLFGGEEAILRRCHQGLACRGYSAETGVAETPLAAWALSFVSENRQEQERDLNARLAHLPLELLTPLHEQFHALARSGLARLGAVLDLPPAALGRRCGRDFVELLQLLRGEVLAPVVHFDPPSCFQDRYPLGYSVRNQQELGPGLEQLLTSLEDYLRQRQLQTRLLHWQFCGLHGYREDLEVRASDARITRQEWYRLTRLRLERQPFREEVELIRLQVSQLEDAHPHTTSLFRQTGSEQSPAQLVDLLSNRLGAQAVSSLRCRDAHLPEHSVSPAPVGSTAGTPQLPAAQRPFWLLPTPEPLRANGDELRFWGSRLTLIYGPERIEDGWWEQPSSRDYFVARNPEGQRFWVFHERRQRRWFMHGLFA